MTSSHLLPDHPVLQPGDWHASCAELARSGWRFAGLYASSSEVVRAIFQRGAALELLSVGPGPEGLDSIVDLFASASFDEREAHDLFAINFLGHMPMRPLVDHQAELSRWTVTSAGDGVHDIAVGPVHAGVIESGHFRFHAVGERVLHLDLKLFYNHRGLERAAGQLPLAQGIAIAQRACAACAVANSLAYAHACEELQGLWPNRPLASMRTALCELERVYNHLHDIGAVCAGIGFSPGAMAFAAMKEEANRLNASLSGHRFLFGATAVNGPGIEIDRAQAHDARAVLSALGQDARRMCKELLLNSSVQRRLRGVGILEHADALNLGTVGPAARASGVASDARIHSRRLSYGEFVPAALTTATGDVAARVEMRMIELTNSFALLDELLASDLRAGQLQVRDAPSDIGIGIIESPRGQTIALLEAREGRIARFHLRTASYANWPSVAHSAANNLLAEFPLINKSFELCYACCDR